MVHVCILCAARGRAVLKGADAMADGGTGPIRRPLSSRLISPTLWKAALASGFAIAAVAGTQLLLVPVPLYTSECAKCFQNVPRLPSLPLLAGVLWVAAMLRYVDHASIRPRDLLAGALIGLVAALYAGLLQTVMVLSVDTYIIGPYRLYGFVFLGGVSMGLAALLTALVRAHPARRMRSATWPLLAAMALSIIDVGSRGQLLIAGTAVAGAAVGVLGRSMLLRWSSLARLATEHRAVLAIALIAFAARALFGLGTLARTGPGMAFAIASDDGDSYFRLATMFVADPGTSALEVLAHPWFPPAYTVFLAGIFALTHQNLAFVVVGQAVLAALSTVFLYQLVRSIAGMWPAAVAAALFALDSNLIQNQSTLTAEAVLVPALLLALWGFTRYRATDQTLWLAVAAAASGIAFMTRNIVALPLIVGAVIWLTVFERKKRLRLLRDLAIIASIVIVTTIPTLIVTTQEGRPRVITQAAQLAWETEVGPITFDNRFLVARGIQPFRDPIGAATLIVSDPGPVAGFFAQAVPHRLRTLFFAGTPGNFDNLVILNPAVYDARYPQLIELLRLAALLVAIVAVVRAGVRSLSAQAASTLGLVLTFAAIYVAIFSLVFPPSHPFRYRIPIVPIIELGEAVGLVLIVRFFVGYLRTTDRAELPRNTA